MADVRAYQLHLIEQWSHINQVACALRFFYGITLGQKEVFERIVYRCSGSARGRRCVRWRAVGRWFSVWRPDPLVEKWEASNTPRYAALSPHAVTNFRP
jgi:hypothetical protein